MSQTLKNINWTDAKIKYAGMKIAGSDETGFGDYLTPLVVAAAYVPERCFDELIQLGLRDSKLLSDEQIVVLAEQIKKLSLFVIKRMPQWKYNELIIQRKFNPDEIKTWLHHQALSDLKTMATLVKFDLIVIDQFAKPEIFQRYLENLAKHHHKIITPFGIKYKLVVHGESEHPAVAAASIIARAELIKLMQRQNEEWGVKFPLGATHVLPFIRKFVHEHGRSSLWMVAKVPFRTTNQVLWDY